MIFYNSHNDNLRICISKMTNVLKELCYSTILEIFWNLTAIRNFGLYAKAQKLSFFVPIQMDVQKYLLLKFSCIVRHS